MAMTTNVHADAEVTLKAVFEAAGRMRVWAALKTLPAMGSGRRTTP
jgi:hypothetical protein